MNIITYDEIVLDSLTDTGVSVLFKTFADINGEKVQIGPNKRISFCNCPTDRQTILDRLPEAQINAILSIWGAEALLNDPTIE